MKLKFDPNLDYQLDAIQSVTDVFDGQPLEQGEFEVSLDNQIGFIEQNELGIGNQLSLSHAQILENVRFIQERNQMEIMIINIDSFNKDTNVMFKEMDQLSGRPPIEFASSTNPVVIGDDLYDKSNERTAY